MSIRRLCNPILLWTSVQAWSSISRMPTTSLIRRSMCYMGEFEAPEDNGIKVVRPSFDDVHYFDDSNDPDPRLRPASAVSKAIMKYHHFRPFAAGTVQNQPLFVGGEDAGTLLNPNIEVLLKHSQPAVFGKGNETVYDEAVRLARSIPADLLKSDKDGKGLKFDDERKVAWLNPDGEVDIRLSKLHIYEKGGHFKPHRDTLCDQNHVGSIVVLLGSAFFGGKFMLHGKNCPLKVDRVRERLPFVSFYTDTVHEIKPVKLGVRASLQFDVYAREPRYAKKPERRSDGWYSAWHDSSRYSPCLDHFFEERPTALPKPFVNETRCKELVTAVENQIGDKDCNALIIPTCHRYTNFALQTSSLKPIDGLVLRKLVERGYSVVPVGLDLYSECFEGYSDRLVVEVDTFGGAQVPEGTVFVVPPTLAGSKFGEQDYIEWTGNNAVAAVLAYRLGGLLIQKGACAASTQPIPDRGLTETEEKNKEREERAEEEEERAGEEDEEEEDDEQED